MTDPFVDPNQMELEPAPEPAQEPCDRHQGPLDDDEDGRWLDPVDPRRRAVEKLRGRPFDNDREDPRWR